MIPTRPDVPTVLAALFPERVPDVVPAVFEPVVFQSVTETFTSNVPPHVPENVVEPHNCTLGPRPDEYVIGLASSFTELGKANPILKKKKATKKMKSVSTPKVCHQN